MRDRAIPTRDPTLRVRIHIPHAHSQLARACRAWLIETTPIVYMHMRCNYTCVCTPSAHHRGMHLRGFHSHSVFALVIRIAQGKATETHTARILCTSDQLMAQMKVMQ